MEDRAISALQVEALHRILTDVLVQAQADAVFVCDTGGNIVDNVSSTRSDLESTIAALGAGSFAATRQLAQIIGEPAFRSVYHRGDVVSIYIQGIGKEFIILVIFGKATTVGMVKLYVEKSQRMIEAIVGRVQDQTPQEAGTRVSFVMDPATQIFDKSAE